MGIGDGFRKFGEKTKEAGHETKTFAKEAGHETKNLAKDVGHGTKNFAKDVGHGAKEVGHESLTFAKDATHEAKVIAKDHINGEAIANEPFIVGGDSVDGVDPVDVDDIEEYKDVKLPLSRQPFMRSLLMVVESILVWWLITAPSWILSAIRSHEKYSIIHFKVGDTGFTPNAYQEFWRWSVFFANCYVAFLFAAWLTGMISTMVLGFSRIFKLPVSHEVRDSLKLVKRTQYYLANFVWLVIMLVMGTLVLYTPDLFKPSGDLKVHRFLVRQNSEKILLACSFIAGMFALEKYFIQVVTHAFHKESISYRIADNNEKRQRIGKLYRACRISTSEARRFNLQDEFSSAGLHEIHYDDLLKDMESDAIATFLFKQMKPENRNFLKPEDFKPYLETEDEAKILFKMLDGELRGKIDESYLRATVRSVYVERDTLLVAVVENGRVIRRFDNALMTVVSILAIVGSLSLFHAKGYTLVVTLFSILLTLAFLIRDTMTRLSDAFRLIYIQRAFDVGDVIKVDGALYTVNQVRLFTSTFMRNSDKVVVYIPNHILASKIIINTKRLALTVDKATITVFGNIPMAKVGAFKDSLSAYTQDNFAEFGGCCALKIKEMGERVDISVDLSFQPATDEKVLMRRDKFKAKVMEILDTLQISAQPPTF